MAHGWCRAFHVHDHIVQLSGSTLQGDCRVFTYRFDPSEPFYLRRVSVACSVTGVGEHIMRAGLARDAARRIIPGDVNSDDACAAALQDGILEVRCC